MNDLNAKDRFILKRSIVVRYLKTKDFKQGHLLKFEEEHAL
jgi:hypothetical protein